ncbi:MAG: hypothetical protein KKA05_04875 [Alphaproteobacteria bacterium]|nr:hypothetical protein [Alphaproteobacteria bacterium]MBU0860022.1 hypothetical protein [Alphaproteobacteria bacterium]
MLSALWRRHAENRKKELRTKDILYVTFAVDDPVLARKLYEWHEGRREAQKAISQFLKDLHAPTLFGPWTTIRYQVDKDGYLSKFAYSGYVPQGWMAEPDSMDNWLVPENGNVMRAVRNLPPMPGPKGLQELLAWPYLDPAEYPRAWQHFAARANHLPRIYGRDGRAFVDLPHPANFSVNPEVAAIIQGWQPPPGLRYAGEHRSARDKFQFI